MLGRLFLGRYNAIRLLGEGGMGCVYLARDEQRHQPVVVKVMHDHLAVNPRFRENFQREADLMARLRHPHAVTLLDASADSPEGPCIVMEYVAGQTLEKILTRPRRFAPARLCRFLTQLCAVLQTAHRQHIIHCDLKPANLIFLDYDTPEERLKVMDFGLARLAQTGAAPAATEPGSPDYAVGTPGYMSPEQARGDPVDARSDLYSVGAILYRLLTGRMPFAGDTTMEILVAQVTETPPTFASLGLDDTIPAGIEELVRACLTADPTQRPGSARELIKAYEAALTQEDEPASPAAPSAGASRPRTEMDMTVIETDEPHADVDLLEVWMPEQMVAFKLRGFAQTLGAKVLEHSARCLRLQFKETRVLEEAPAGPLSWLGIGSKKPVVVEEQGIEMELHLRKPDRARPDCLQIYVTMRPLGIWVPALPPDWGPRCRHLQRTLRSFLMCKG